MRARSPHAFILFILFCLRRPAFRRWSATRSRTLTVRKMLIAFFRNFCFAILFFALQILFSGRFDCLQDQSCRTACGIFRSAGKSVCHFQHVFFHFKSPASAGQNALHGIGKIFRSHLELEKFFKYLSVQNDVDHGERSPEQFSDDAPGKQKSKRIQTIGNHKRQSRNGGFHRDRSRGRKSAGSLLHPPGRFLRGAEIANFRFGCRC